MEKIEQGKRAGKNRKRPHPPGDHRDSESALKHPRIGRGDVTTTTVSSTPPPLNPSRPGSVLSMASSTVGGEAVNGGGPTGEDFTDPPGSVDGSEVNLDISGPGTTPVRKLPKSRLETVRGDTARKVKRTSAPLGGRGKMQKSSNKKTGVSRSAAASAGAIAGAKAATSAAYAAYGLPTHHISPSPSGSSPTVAGSTHSSPRVSPVPMAFVATSLVTTPPTNKPSSKVQSSLAYAKSNNL